MKQEAWLFAARLAVVFLLMVTCVGGACAQSFLTTHTMTLNKAEWSASVEFPTGGDKAVVEHVLRWIADVLDDISNVSVQERVKREAAELVAGFPVP